MLADELEDCICRLQFKSLEQRSAPQLSAEKSEVQIVHARSRN
jgi:hypothetical protein